MAGTLLLVKQAYDGISDPVVGTVSDRTQSRIGRRKPWVYFSSIPAGILWIFIWLQVPFITSEIGRFFYYLTALLLFNTGWLTWSVLRWGWEEKRRKPDLLRPFSLSLSLMPNKQDTRVCNRKLVSAFFLLVSSTHMPEYSLCIDASRHGEQLQW
jgi:MFS/sugar transport protein